MISNELRRSKLMRNVLVVFMLTCFLMAPLGITMSNASIIKENDDLTSYGRGLANPENKESLTFGPTDGDFLSTTSKSSSGGHVVDGNGALPSKLHHAQQDNVTENVSSRPTFKVNSLLGYLKQAYVDGKGYLDTPVDGSLTTVSTYQALFASRVFGLEYYQFSTFRSSLESQIASNLAENFRQSNASLSHYGGFYLVSGAVAPTLEGTFGAIATIDLTGQSILYETQLINRSDVTPRFVLYRNYTFSVDPSESFSPNITLALAFRDTWPETIPTIRATFDAVFTLLTLHRPEFNATHALQVLNFLKSKFNSSAGLFDDGSQFTNPIVQTWLAIRLIDWLLPMINAANLTQTPLTVDDVFNTTTTIQAIRDAQELTSDSNPRNASSMYGGFSFVDGKEPDVEQTGAALAVLSELGVPLTNENKSVINRTAALYFFNRSQFIDTKVSLPLNKLFGGFASNPRLANRTVAGDDFRPEFINMNNLFWVSLGALVSGWISENLEVTIETSVYLNDRSYGMSNYLIQGEISTVNLRFMVGDSQYSHGELRLTNLTIPTWNLDHDTEANPNAFPRNATYQFTVLNDTDRNYNWSLGLHPVKGEYQIRSLNLIDPLTFNFTSEVYVGYRITLVKFNSTSTANPIPTTITPNGTLLLEVHVQNRSLFTYRAHNITTGNVTFLLIDPSGETMLNQTHVLNATVFRPVLNYTFANDSLLGTWRLQVLYEYNKSAVGPTDLLLVNKTRDVNVETSIQLLDFGVNGDLYPGSPLNITVSMAYPNGFISPKVNASLNFKFKESSRSVFSVKLVHVNATNFTVAKTERVPQKLIMGSYELSITFTWNTTRKSLITELTNETLMKAAIKGKVVALDAAIINPRQTYGVLDEVKANITIGVLLPNGTAIPVEPLLELSNASNSQDAENTSSLQANDVLIAFLTNASNLEDVVDVFNTQVINASLNRFNVTLMLNPNLQNDDYAISFKVKLPTNESFVFIRDVNDNARSILNLTLTYKASFEAVDFSLRSSDGTPIPENSIAREEGFAVIAFKVQTTDNTATFVPNLSLYAILRDANGNNVSVLAVAYVASSSEYQLVFSLLSLESGQYQIDIYTVSAIKPDTKINKETFSFAVFEEQQLPIEPIIQAGVLVTLVIISAVVLYLNYRVRKNFNS